MSAESLAVGTGQWPAVLGVAADVADGPLDNGRTHRTQHTGVVNSSIYLHL